MTKPTTALGSGRGRGRPRIGTPATTRLNDDDLAVALELGDGIEALGLRRAVQVAAAMGIAAAKRLALQIEKVQLTADTQAETSPIRNIQKIRVASNDMDDPNLERPRNGN